MRLDQIRSHLTSHLFLSSKLDKMFKLLGTPNLANWPDVVDLPHAKKWDFFKKIHPCRLRDKLPRSSYTGDAYLSDTGYDLLIRMLNYNPDKRITAKEELSHPYFKEIPPAQDPSLMPTFPSLNEGRKKKKDRESNELRAQRDQNCFYLA